jgi:hypothetical protein
MFNIWNRIRKSMDKPTITSVPLSKKSDGQSNPKQTGNRISAYDVQSWNPETHPEGRGRSLLVQDINYDDGHLSVTYNDGFTAGYEGISPEQAKDFVTSDSKGRWALKHLWDLPYKKE